MAMGIVSDEDFIKEIESHNRVPAKPVIARIEEKKERGWNGGRNEGDSNIPDVLKKVIGGSAIESGKHSLIAKTFGVSESSVSAYKNGAHSTATYYSPDKELREHILGKKREVSDRARTTLLEALDYITPDKLTASKAKDLAGVAKDMSAVIKNMEENVDNEKSGDTTIVFYSPRTRAEEEYAVIEVRDEH